MYFTKPHDWYVQQLGHDLKDIEHFRIHPKFPDLFNNDKRYNQSAPQHVAVVVLTNGHCFVGRANTSNSDIYNHKIGYTLSVSRALKKAVNPFHQGGFAWRGLTAPDFIVDNELECKELRLEVSRLVFGRGF